MQSRERGRKKAPASLPRSGSLKQRVFHLHKVPTHQIWFLGLSLYSESHNALPYLVWTVPCTGFGRHLLISTPNHTYRDGQLFCRHCSDSKSGAPGCANIGGSCSQWEAEPACPGTRQGGPCAQEGCGAAQASCIRPTAATSITPYAGMW